MSHVEGQEGQEATTAPIISAPDSAPVTAPITAPIINISTETGGRTFADMPISPEILAALTAMGFTAPTPIQAAAIEPALAGRDLILRAKTGTGKTAAFGIPLLDRIPDATRQTRALVLAPTRELALQIATELSNIGRFKDLQIAAIYGGVGFGPQIDALKSGAEVVVGTPGRLLDHIKRGNLNLGNVQWLVLDEADEMLSMGFLEDVRKIVDRTPDTRQTMLCSATLNDSLQGFVGRYMKNPEHILLSSDGDNVDSIENILYETSPDYHKARALVDLLEKEQPSSAIIFCNTREDVNTVYTYLERQGFRTEMLTGELPQNKRERVMAKIRSGSVQYLVATDVAARGIDIQDLSHVINYALPDDAAIYLHRIGRTGRAGRSGTALALVGGADFSTRLTLERTHKVKFIVRDLPGPEELIKLRADRVGRTLRESSGSTAYEGYLDVVRGLRNQPDSDILFATALRAWFLWEHSRRQENEEPDAEPRADDRPRDDRPRDDRSRDDRPRDDRPRDDRSRDDRPRDDRSRDDRPRDDRSRDDRSRDDRPRDDRSRDDRPRDDRPRDDRPRDDRPRDDRPRDDRPRDGRSRDRRDDRPRDDRNRDRRDEQARDDRPRDEQPRDEQPRDEQPRDEQPRDEQPRDERPRDERPRDERPREDRSRGDRSREGRDRRDDRSRDGRDRRDRPRTGDQVEPVRAEPQPEGVPVSREPVVRPVDSPEIQPTPDIQPDPRGDTAQQTPEIGAPVKGGEAGASGEAGAGEPHKRRRRRRRTGEAGSAAETGSDGGAAEPAE